MLPFVEEGKCICFTDLRYFCTDKVEIASVISSEKRSLVTRDRSSVKICHTSSAWYNWNFFFPFIFISWRLIILQYCGGFCHTLTWISHGFTCVLHPDPSSRLPLHPIPLGLPSDLSHASNLGWWCLSPLIVYLFQCCRTGIFNQGLLYFRVVFLPLPLLQYKYRPYTKTLQILKAY